VPTRAIAGRGDERKSIRLGRRRNADHDDGVHTEPAEDAEEHLREIPVRVPGSA